MIAAEIITIDVRTAQAEFERIGESLGSGYEATLRAIGKRAGQSVGENFLRRGRPDIWKALAETTIDAREARAKRTGKEPVAGMDAPLRVDDTLRKAASASEPGTEGSEVAIGPWQWSNTLTLPYAAIQDQGGQVHVDRLFGREGVSAAIDIPARPYFFFQDSDETEFVDLLYADIQSRINQSLETP